MGRCGNPKTRWNGMRCVTCIINLKPGQEIVPNCGYDDDGNRHEPPVRPCKDKTFNDGSMDYCKPCSSSCPPGQHVVKVCNETSDFVCAELRTGMNGVTVSIMAYHTAFTSIPPPVSNTAHLAVHWAVPVAVLVSLIITAVALYIGKVIQKRGREAVGYNSGSPCINRGFTNAEVEDVPDVNILSAPLKTLLDNLDVLEELVILLDPERRGIKSTKHLASLCSFSSTWITYTYSMRDSRSPLKAVLEGVTCRDPGWTVGDLAKLLRQMERNDAIAALAKLRVVQMDV